MHIRTTLTHQTFHYVNINKFNWLFKHESGMLLKTELRSEKTNGCNCREKNGFCALCVWVCNLIPQIFSIQICQCDTSTHTHTERGVQLSDPSSRAYLTMQREHLHLFPAWTINLRASFCTQCQDKFEILIQSKKTNKQQKKYMILRALNILWDFSPQYYYIISLSSWIEYFI